MKANPIQIFIIVEHLNEILSKGVLRRIQIRCQRKKDNKYFNNALEISSDDSDEEASNKSDISDQSDQNLPMENRLNLNITIASFLGSSLYD